MPENINQTESTGGRWGVVVVAHGSQRGASPEECSCNWQAAGASPPDWCLHCPNTPTGLKEATDRLQHTLGIDRATVELSCLEFIEPRPNQTIHNLASQGLSNIVVMPYLLGQGKHVTLEMDEILDEVRAELPNVTVHLADPLGPDPRMAHIVVDRIRYLETSLGTSPVENRPTGVLLVKAGTKNQYDNCLWMHELGRMVEKNLGLGYAVGVAQSHYGDPTFQSAASHLVEERNVSAVIVVPYLFFPGLILKRNIIGEMGRMAEKYPHIPLTVTPPLGVTDEVVAVAAHRVQEVWDRV